MPKKPHTSKSAHGEGPSPHHGEQHGWSPDIDAQKQQPNPSAHRSFHPDEYAPEPDPGHTPGDRDASLREVPSRTGESVGRSGEEHAKRKEKGMHSQGRRGRSQRPSGSRDSRAYTGVDPQEPGDDT